MQFRNVLTLLSLLSVSTFSTLALADEGAVAIQEAPQAPVEDLVAREALPEPKKGGGGGGSKNKTEDDDKKNDSVGVAVPLGMLSVLGAGVVAGGLLGF